MAYKNSIENNEKPLYELSENELKTRIAQLIEEKRWTVKSESDLLKIQTHLSQVEDPEHHVHLTLGRLVRLLPEKFKPNFDHYFDPKST